MLLKGALVKYAKSIDQVVTVEGGNIEGALHVRSILKGFEMLRAEKEDGSNEA